MKIQLFSTLLFACSLTTLTAQTPVYLDDTQPIEARVKDALNRMTLEYLTYRIRLCSLHFDRLETPASLIFRQNQVTGSIGKAYFTRGFGYNGAHL